MLDTAIDLYSGFGGAYEAAKAAGLKVVHSANHAPIAVKALRANTTPDHTVECQDLHLADFTKWRDHTVGLAGPSCKGFTRARGKDKPHHDHLRASMWNVVTCAEIWREKVWVVENVPEVMNWVLWPAWVAAMKALGYSLSFETLDAADFGVPQHRVRVFIVATQTKNPVSLDLNPWKTDPVGVRSFIDWDYKRWSPVHKPGRSEKVLNQIAQGRADLKTDRFLIPYYGSGSGLTGRSLDRPCGTIVSQDVWAIVDGDRMRMMQPHEAQLIMGFRADYKRVGTRREQMRGFGNAWCPPVATAIIEAVAQQTGLISLAA